LSGGRQFWESRTKKTSQLTRVSVKRRSDNRGSTVYKTSGEQICM
jgi:hypothetical protein